VHPVTWLTTGAQCPLPNPAREASAQRLSLHLSHAVRMTLTGARFATPANLPDSPYEERRHG